MVACSFSHRDTVKRDVCISDGQQTQYCCARIDADCWTHHGAPIDIAGSLDIPKSEWQALAGAERLVLTVPESGETYRMILDGITGRFLAHRL